MYNNNKQYILKQFGGTAWSFFLDEKDGLCYSTLTKRNIWTPSVSLHKDVYKSFYADIDSDDCFHILFQDRNGNLHYSILNGSNVKNTPILSSKSPTSYDKYLSLIPLKNTTHFFYVIQHNDSLLLSHQTLNNSQVSPPKVIDYVFKSNYPYSCLYDKSGNIYAFYQSSDGKHLQLGYKKYNISQKSWGEFTPITRHQGDCELISVLIDASSTIHLSLQRRSDKHHELVYLQKMPDKNLWTNETIVHTSVYPFTDSSVIVMNGKVIVYWVRDDVIYYGSSNDGGKKWSKPARYNFSPGKQLVHMIYKSNTPYDTEKVAVRSIPGNFLNGFKMAFYQEPSAEQNSPPANELKSIVVDGLKLMNENIDELKESINNIKESIARLDSSYQGMEKDVIKNTIRAEKVENEISKLKLAINDINCKVPPIQPEVVQHVPPITASIPLPQNLDNRGFIKIVEDIEGLPSREELINMFRRNKKKLKRSVHSGNKKFVPKR